jgi:thioester reductase-like protein
MSASPQQQFEGRTVLLTGALGFLGSVVLEQLLRLTNVRIDVLCAIVSFACE